MQNKYVDELKQQKQPVLIGMKFQPPLTRRRRMLLKIANKKFACIEQIQFSYADMHRNITVMLKFPLQRRYVLQIHKENDIANILSRLDCDCQRFGEIYLSDSN